VVLDPGSYLWTSPAGYQYLVDHRGTRPLGRPGQPGQPGQPGELRSRDGRRATSSTSEGDPPEH
jgi:hypothetical protein